MAGPPNIRLYVPGPYGAGLAPVLNRDQAHYLFGVMRRKAGDIIGVFNGTDGEWQAEITDISRKAVTIRLVSRVRPQRQLPDLWLCFAPLKKARIDYLAQKATEMGAAVLQPVLTERTMINRVNVDRLRTNAIEAAEQCTLTTVPEVTDPVKLEQLLDNWDPRRHLMFCDETASDQHSAAETLRNFVPGEPWGILIGPEGGFSPLEVDMIRDLPNAVPVSLGPRIMRADTAIVAAMAVWQAILGDWQNRISIIGK